MEQAIAQVRTWQDQFARLPLTQKLRQLSLNPETTLQLAQVRAREMDGQEGNQQEGNQQDANPERLGQQVRLWGELDNLLTVAQLLLKSAHFRQESRGGHYRGDYPHTDPQWQVHTVIEGDRWSQVPLQ
jgi:L-aspartate oxidase